MASKKKADKPAFVETIDGKKAATFDYIKGNHHRVVHVNGAHGGLSSRGDFIMNVYSERYAIPKRVSHALLPSDAVDSMELGDEVKREQLPAIVREVDATLAMSPRAAESIARWMLDRLGKVITVTDASEVDDARDE